MFQAVRHDFHAFMRNKRKVKRFIAKIILVGYVYGIFLVALGSWLLPLIIIAFLGGAFWSACVLLDT